MPDLACLFCDHKSSSITELGLHLNRSHPASDDPLSRLFPEEPDLNMTEEPIIDETLRDWGEPPANLVPNPASPVLSTEDGVQRLVCLSCGDHWSRPASAGRPPKYCPKCRRLGPPLPSEAPVAPVAAPERPKGDERRHREFSTLLAVATARVPAMLVGPAGSGKTSAGRQVAEALSLAFHSESCSPMMTKWDLMGFVGPNGNYVPGVFREAFENGGVVLLDEIDASNPAILVSINMIASVSIGETVRFPDGNSIPRHPDFVLIAGANTFGDGASDQYVGREQLDAATLDRFATIRWDYDLDLERVASGDDTIGQEWVMYVQAVRKAAEDAGIEMLVTPRASINGAHMIRSGMSVTTVAELIVWKGISKDARRSVEAKFRDPREPNNHDRRPIF